MATEKPWDKVSLAQLEKNAEKVHTFCEEEIAKLLPEIMERTEQKYNSMVGNSYLMFVAKLHTSARA